MQKTQQQRYAKITRKGIPKSTLQETYSQMMADSWATFSSKVIAYFFILNIFFASCFYVIPNSIEGIKNVGYLEAFNFSIQTFSTIGYGSLTPNGFYGNLVVAFESFAGIVYMALLTGLLYSRFSKPIPSFQVSNKMVSRYEGNDRIIQFRAVNTRGHELINMEVQLHVIKNRITNEGKRERYIQTLQLARSHVPLLFLNWVFTHTINEESPLWSEFEGEKLKSDLQLFVNMNATDGTIHQSVHLHQIYQTHDIAYGHKFIDMIETKGENVSVEVDKIHLSKPVNTTES